ncbi:PREDICTED: uncharacterized protein LOC101311172 [Fragaria vesca subsp. vesca]|uniref:leucine-rich repeat extensin-like protein 3 n=1 Tax=Fragaria vesca subsp. vesca TaxID=101020 RepID=UPI0002C34702|nr:PREDICTED: leucine-rich repeat extensin-like protein 3 [Fragaria vesca subsp. vesca]
MSYYSNQMNPGAMFSNGSDPNQPSYNTNSGPQAQAQPPANNGYPGYAPPPPASYGYYNPNHPPQGGSAAPPPHAPYGYYPPPLPSYNNGHYDPRFYQAPVRRSAKPKTPSKPKAARSGPKNVSYKVAGNRVSGNTGDHNGVFNVGNKNSGRCVDDDDDEDEY